MPAWIYTKRGDRILGTVKDRSLTFEQWRDAKWTKGFPAGVSEEDQRLLDLAEWFDLRLFLDPSQKPSWFPQLIRKPGDPKPFPYN